MKPIFTNRIWYILVTSCIGTTASAQSGGAFDLSWFTIDDGGGTSSGGAFTLNATIGQPDAGTMSGGAFTVAGGFWSVTLPNSPRLRITLSGPNVILAWPDPSTGFLLQGAGALPATPGSWANVGPSPVVTNGEKQVTLPHSSSKQFYRLARP